MKNATFCAMHPVWGKCYDCVHLDNLSDMSANCGCETTTYGNSFYQYMSS